MKIELPKEKILVEILKLGLTIVTQIEDKNKS